MAGIWLLSVALASCGEGGCLPVSPGGLAALASGRVAGRVAVVFGGSQGIGEGICEELAKEGATVLVVSREAAKAQKVAARLPGAWFAEASITSSSEVDRLVASAAQALGRVDIVVNSAGMIGDMTPTDKQTDANWKEVVDVNLNAAFYIMRAAARQMVGQTPQGGVIVSIASIAAHQGMETLSPYTAAKAGVIGLTQTMAIEYATRGVRVAAVSPTATETPLVENFLKTAGPATKAGFTFHNPMPGMPQPSDIGKAVLFLCSDDARFVTGSVLPVDGGYLAGSAYPHVRGEVGDLFVSVAEKAQSV